MPLNRCLCPRFCAQQLAGLRFSSSTSSICERKDLALIEGQRVTLHETVVLPDFFRSVPKRAEDEFTAAVRLPVRKSPKRLPPMPTTNELLNLYRLRARKQMSQNFLLNPRVCDRLVESSHIREGTRVLEIGPGPGNISRRILERNPAEFYVVEKDRRFLPMLEQLADAASPGQMKIIVGDCLDYSFDSLFPPSLAKDWQEVNDDFTVVGNLPFAVSIPLLIRWLSFMSTRSGPFAFGRVPMTLTFQKEVAMRLGAPVLSMHRSRISIMTQTFCDVKIKFLIKGASFTPAPNVDVAVVRLVPKERSFLPEGMDFKSYEKFVRTLVHYRRFPLRKNLNDLFPRDKSHLVDEILRPSTFSDNDLPLMLSAKEVAQMAGTWFRLCRDNPGLLEYDYRARQQPPRIVKQMFRKDHWA